MKKLLLFLAFLFSTLAMANPWTVRQDTSSTNLTASFAALIVLTGPNQLLAVQVDNSSGSEIEVNCSEGTLPSSNALDSFFVAANATWSTPPNTPLGKKCWWRSVSGTVTSGIIRVTGWGY